MPGHHEYVHVEPEEPTTPPPYMDPGNAIAKKKSIAQKKKSLAAGIPPSPDRCAHCGAQPQHQNNPVYIWPAPRPVDHIRPENSKFIGYVVLIAIVIFLLFAACKYLP